MKGKPSLNQVFYLMTVLLMITGILLVYLGVTKYARPEMVNMGYWSILISTLAFLLRNALYVFEGSDPDNMVSFKLS